MSSDVGGGIRNPCAYCRRVSYRFYESADSPESLEMPRYTERRRGLLPGAKGALAKQQSDFRGGLRPGLEDDATHGCPVKPHVRAVAERPAFERLSLSAKA